MAFAITSNPTNGSAYQAILRILHSFVQATARRRAYLETRRELSSLSDAMLADLGLTRSQINRVSHDAAIGLTD